MTGEWHGKFSMTSVGAGRNRVQIDGIDVSKAVSGVEMEALPFEPPVVTLTLKGLDRLDLSAEVRLPADTHAALVALGWTPPNPTIDPPREADQ